MVLKNDNTENYVSLDMTEVDMLNYHDDSSIPYEVKLACDDKVRFRKRMAIEKIGILRIDYILRVMRKVFFDKASVSNPDSYKDKLKSFERAQRAARKLTRRDSESS